MIVLSLGREDRRVAESVPDVIQPVVLLSAEHPPGDAVTERVRRDDVEGRLTEGKDPTCRCVRYVPASVRVHYEPAPDTTTLTMSEAKTTRIRSSDGPRGGTWRK